MHGSPDFSGEWNLDLELSRLEIPAPTCSTVRIEHREPSFDLYAQHVWEERSRTVHFELTTDGKEVVEKEADGRVTHLRMYWEGDTLILDAWWPEGEAKATNIVKYSLSADGRTLMADERAKALKYAYHNLWIMRKS